MNQQGCCWVGWRSILFYTIRTVDGQPAVFIRVAGVLRCHWCDTDYEHGEVG